MPGAARCTVFGARCSVPGAFLCTVLGAGFVRAAGGETFVGGNPGAADTSAAAAIFLSASSSLSTGAETVASPSFNRRASSSMRFLIASIAALFASLCTTFFTVLGGLVRPRGIVFCTGVTAVSSPSFAPSVSGATRFVRLVLVALSPTPPDIDVTSVPPEMRFRVFSVPAVIDAFESSISAVFSTTASVADARDRVVLVFGAERMDVAFVAVLARLGGIVVRNR